jgi:hypothetical protein
MILNKKQGISEVQGQWFYFSQLLDRLYKQISRYSGQEQNDSNQHYYE